MSFRASDSALVHGFQAFYYELLRQKEKALSMFFAPVKDGNDENENSEVEGLVVGIQKKMIAIIDHL